MVTAAAAARALLLEHLDYQQRLHFTNLCQFYCKGNKSGDVYKVTAGFVYRLRDNHRFCIGLKDKAIPYYDEILAKKVLIECDERRFLRVAIDHDTKVLSIIEILYKPLLVGCAIGFLPQLLYLATAIFHRLF